MKRKHAPLLLFMALLMPLLLPAQGFFPAHFTAAENGLMEFSSLPGSHTALRPYFTPDVHLPNGMLSGQRGRFSGEINPLIHLSGGMELTRGKAWHDNRLGLQASGQWNNKWYAGLQLSGGLVLLPDFQQAATDIQRMLPDGSHPHYLGDQATLLQPQFYLAWRPNRFFTLQTGMGKHFWGHGQRSLLLSDNSYPYPYFQISTKVWKLHYVCMWAWLKDATDLSADSWNDFDNKYGAFHYLSLQIGKRWEVAVFEAVMWGETDTAYHRGMEINYLNPIIFYRPIEYDLGSPDNALMGINIGYKAGPRTRLYGQLALDEFKLDEIKAQNGWWANKFAVQIGAKQMGLSKHPELFIQTELNLARPFMWSHRNPLNNFGHYNRSLAHPLGANFVEAMLLIQHPFMGGRLQLKNLWALYGTDAPGTNYGQNIFISYQSHTKEYHNYIGQGRENKLWFSELKYCRPIRPGSGIQWVGSVAYRHHRLAGAKEQDLFLSLGISSRLKPMFRAY